MKWCIIIFTVCVSTKQLESAPYGGHQLFDYQYSSGSDQPKTYFHQKQFPEPGFYGNIFLEPEHFMNRPMVHGPQVDFNEQDFRPLGEIPPFGFGNGDFNGRPPRPNSFGSRPGRQSVVLPPSEDYSDEVFIFDVPTSPRPTRPTTTPTPPTTTFRPAANCDCPTTPEFNPVCGSDSQTYNNPAKLKCAVFCGADVRLKHYGACIESTTSITTSTTTTTTTTPATVSRILGRNRL